MHVNSVTDTHVYYIMMKTAVLGLFLFMYLPLNKKNVAEKHIKRLINTLTVLPIKYFAICNLLIGVTV